MVRTFAYHLPLHLALWILLTGGPAASWLVGAPVAVLAAWAGAAMAPAVRWPLRPLAVAAFLPFFLWHSLRGAWDVGRRALQPSLPVAPGRLRYACALPAGAPRTLFANAVSLLPGTLFLADRDGTMELHAVDRELPLDRDLALLERRVAALFGIEPGGTR